METKIKTVLFMMTAFFASIAFAEPAERPRWVPGDSWVYLRTAFPTPDFPGTLRRQFTFSVADVGRRSYGFIRSYSESDGQTHADPLKHWSLNLNWYEKDATGKNREIERFRWPLTEGASWTVPTLAPVTRDAAEIHMTVGDWEYVTVPAGRFRALKVRYWLPFVANAYAAGVDRTWWYAPEVKMYVRFQEMTYSREWLVNHTVEELVSYKLGSDK